MKRIVIIGLILVAFLTIQAKTAQEWIDSTLKVETKSIKDAIKIMEKATAEYPNNPDILSLYGLMLSKRAGEVTIFSAAGFASRAETEFDKALEIDPDHKNARLWRGILRVHLPKFLGKLDLGIEDLAILTTNFTPEEEEFKVIHYYLGQGYQKANQEQAAREAYQVVLNYGVNAPFYTESVSELKKLTGLTEEELLESYKE